MWEDYFDLRRDYGDVRRTLCALHPVMQEAADYASGIRILSQEPFEALITFIIRRVMLKSVDKAREASEFVTPEGLSLLERWDHFTHTTVTTRSIAKKSESRSGGGGSGRSGKF